MKQLMKIAVFSLSVLLAMPVCAQNRLKPYCYDYMRYFSRLNYICWGYRVEPSFDETYEINAFKDGNFSDIKSKSEDIVSLTKAYIEQLQEQYREYFTLRIEKKPEGWWREEF